VVRSREAALEAARELLVEQGWSGVTHVAVAARSGVGRTTLYRHWPEVTSLLFDAIAGRIEQVRPAPTGDLRADLCRELDGLRQLLHDPVGELGMRAVIDRAPFDPAFGHLKKALYQAGSAGFRAILTNASTRGDLAPGADIDLIVDQLAGPLIFRRLLADRTIDPSYVEIVVDDVCKLHGNEPSATAHAPHQRAK
jgi:AcrR family transcriptional regulator